MKKNLTQLYIASFIGAASILRFAQAQTGFDNPPEKLKNPLRNTNSINELLANILDVILYLSVPVLVLVFIWSGFQFVMAQGNETKLTKAKNSLFWSLVGAFIIISIKLIMSVITNTVSGINS